MAWDLPARAQSLQCFYQTAATNFSNSYFGNDVTHGNTGLPRSTEVNAALAGFGRNGFILDGPVFYVGTECTTSHVTFDVYSADTYSQHCICTGGSAAGQGCTTISATTGQGIAGSCPGGGTATLYNNKYDVGLYCMGGNCIFGKLYASTGLLDYSELQPGIRTLPWASAHGGILLPVGTYAVAMGTNCDSGSVAGQTDQVTVLHSGTTVEWYSGPLFVNDGSWNNTPIYIGDPTFSHTISSVSSDGKSLTLTGVISKTGAVGYVQGAISAKGDKRCLQARGEGNGYGAGGKGSGWVGGTQLFATKDFVTALDPVNSKFHADCLLFDPYHDNSIGLPGESLSFPPTLAAYDSGGCTYVNNARTGIAPLTPFGQAPHMIDFAIW